MINANMACGVIGDQLIVRVGPENYSSAMAHKDTLPFDMTGRSMKGWVMVRSEGIEEDPALRSWIATGLEFARALPPK